MIKIAKGRWNLRMHWDWSFSWGNVRIYLSISSLHDIPWGDDAHDASFHISKILWRFCNFDEACLLSYIVMKNCFLRPVFLCLDRLKKIGWSAWWVELLIATSFEYMFVFEAELNCRYSRCIEIHLLWFFQRHLEWDWCRRVMVVPRQKVLL